MPIHAKIVNLAEEQDAFLYKEKTALGGERSFMRIEYYGQANFSCLRKGIV